MATTATTHSDKLPTGKQRGVCVKFDADRGFGFIRPATAAGAKDQDVFVHVRNIDGRKVLRAGQPVTYHVTRTDKGPAAIKVRPGSVLATPFLRYLLIGLGSALLLLVGLANALDRPASFALWLLFWVIAMSLTALGLYGYDKAQAINGGQRIPEAVLHLVTALGGSPGAFVGMRLFHHKTGKAAFQVVFWVILAVQLALAAWWFALR
jgi:uncharacterized membrane protein YsdA (DUF1294 family)/cold shock CspA family protein